MRMRWFLLLALLVAVSSAYSKSKYIIRGHYRAPPTEKGETWALLVAGSNGWYNYRHQADVAHSYQILKKHGIPEDRIIVMMYDDVANNRQNPFRGKLFNRPHGEDVYAGVKIDYKHNDVTPENFLNVLKGNKTGVTGGNRRVIESTADDRVFVYFTDHGAVGLIAFPDGILSVKDLTDSLNWLYKHKRYDQLVFYLEACESGSMFEKVLKENINIYAITAANSHESSWGTYCDNDMGLPCLGDLFSVNWMDDSDKEDLDVETLEYQYELVKKTTDKSHVMHFGNLTIAEEPVGWFQGAKKNGKKINYIDTFKTRKSSWPSRDVELLSLMRMRDQENDLAKLKNITGQIRKIHQTRKWVKETFHGVVDNLVKEESERKRMFAEKRPVTNLGCHHEVTASFNENCIALSQVDYAMKYVYVLNNLCDKFKDSELIIEEMVTACIMADYQRRPGYSRFKLLWG